MAKFSAHILFIGSVLFINFNIGNTDSISNGNFTSSQLTVNNQPYLKTQPSNVFLSCFLEGRFQMTVSNGNITGSCLLNQSALERTIDNYVAPNRLSENQVFGLQRKGQDYLSRDHIVSVCKLTCSRGVPYFRRRPLLYPTNGVEPNDINIGCDDYQDMRCKGACTSLPPVENGIVLCTDAHYIGSVCRVRCNRGYVNRGPVTQTCREQRWSPLARFRCVPDTLGQLLTRHIEMARNNITLRSLCSANLKRFCATGVTERECYNRGCCWKRIYMRRMGNYHQVTGGCFRPKERIRALPRHTSRDTANRKSQKRSRLSSMLTRLNLFNTLNALSGTSQRPKVYTTSLLSPGNPAPCGCAVRTNNLQTCNDPTGRTRLTAPPSRNVVATLKRDRTVVPRIYRGSNAKIQEWPWHAVIFFKTYLCGGTLLSDLFVVTAAHCVTSQDGSLISSGYVYLGMSNISKSNERGRRIRSSASVIRHENFTISSDGHSQNDLALIKLNKPISTQGPYIKPLCLPGPRVPQTSDHCYVTGFGRLSGSGIAAQVLQEACMPLINMKECRNTYGNYVRSDQHICAGKLTPNSADTCRGDSGGPLVCRRATAMGTCLWYLAGVTAFGRSPCGSGAPSVYMNISHYQGWILQTINRMNNQQAGTTTT